MKHAYIEVIDRKTGAVTHRLDCHDDGTNWRKVDRIERGMGINMSDQYRTRQQFSEEILPCGDVDEPAPPNVNKKENKR